MENPGEDQVMGRWLRQERGEAEQHADVRGGALRNRRALTTGDEPQANGAAERERKRKRVESGGQVEGDGQRGRGRRRGGGCERGGYGVVPGAFVRDDLNGNAVRERCGGKKPATAPAAAAAPPDAQEDDMWRENTETAEDEGDYVTFLGISRRSQRLAGR